MLDLDVTHAHDMELSTGTSQLYTPGNSLNQNENPRSDFL